MELPVRKEIVLDVLSNPDNSNMSLTAIAESLGISVSTLYRYRQDPQFQSELIARRKAYRSLHGGEVDNALMKAVRSGEVSAMKLFYQLSGELDEEAKGDAVQAIQINIHRIESD